MFHSAGWLEALHRSYGYEPIALTLADPTGRALRAAIIFCRIESPLTGRRLVSLPFSDHCDPLVDSDEQYIRLLRELERERTAGGWSYIELRPRLPLTRWQGPFARCRPYYLYRLDLTRDPRALMEGFHKNHVVRKIRRAEREGLTYAEGQSAPLLRSFYQLLLKTRRRHGLPPQPLTWFRSILDCLPDQIRIRVASKNGVPVAAMVTLCHGSVMTYKYGASDAAAHALGAVQFLFWRTIQDAQARGCTELDLGRSAPENAGENAFKTHWGPSCEWITYLRDPAQPHHPGLMRRLGTTCAHRLFSAMPDRLLVAAGTALYPHIA